MERVYLGEIRQHLEKEILLQGFVENFRDGKAMAFLVMKDITGKVQVTIEKEKHPEQARRCYTLAQRGRMGNSASAALAHSWRRSGNREEAARRMDAQLQNAREWRDITNTFFHRLSGVEDAHGRKIYD